MKHQTIGILAGMGPRSTGAFIDLVITECQLQYGAKDDIDFPKMLIYSVPTPFLQWQKGSFVISTEKARLQLNRVHQFLSTQAYWCLNIPFEIVEKAAKDSLCFGLFDEQHDGHPQIGYARVVTDHTTFAYLCDVYIEPAYRGIGLSKWLMNCLMEHPSMKGLRRICLATKDAHSLYSKYGFEVTQTPNRWMEIKNDNLYQKR